MNNNEAYHRLTRELCNFYATERDALDASTLLGVLLECVALGNDDVWAAETAAKHFRTESGDAWRVRRFGSSKFVN